MADAPVIRHEYADLGEVRLHYAMAGEGPAVVLLHGWPQTWYMWRGIIPGLAARYRVIAPDLRGLGDSSRPRRLRQEDLAQDVWRLAHEVLGEERCSWWATTGAARWPSRWRRSSARRCDGWRSSMCRFRATDAGDVQQPLAPWPALGEGSAGGADRRARGRVSRASSTGPGAGGRTRSPRRRSLSTSAPTGSRGRCGRVQFLPRHAAGRRRQRGFLARDGRLRMPVLCYGGPLGGGAGCWPSNPGGGWPRMCAAGSPRGAATGFRRSGRNGRWRSCSLSSARSGADRRRRPARRARWAAGLWPCFFRRLAGCGPPSYQPRRLASRRQAGLRRQVPDRLAGFPVGMASSNCA